MMSLGYTLLLIFGLVTGILIVARLIRWLRLIARAGYFTGKVVLITGASRGIGRALAHAFAARGARLVLAARNQDQLNTVADECRSINPHIEILIVPTDVTDEAQRENLVRAAIERFGQIDILVNNAGIRQGGALLEQSREAIRLHIEANLMSAVWLTYQVLPHMISRGQGYIVNIASAAGRHTEPYFIAYGVSKHGLIGFGEGLRREMAAKGIRALTVNPGFTGTEMTSQIGPVYRRMGFAMIPPERIARRTLEGILLRKPEVNIGWLEAFGGYASVLAPRIADLYWRLLMPREFPEAAARQHSE